MPQGDNPTGGSAATWYLGACATCGNPQTIIAAEHGTHSCLDCADRRLWLELRRAEPSGHLQRLEADASAALHRRELERVAVVLEYLRRSA